MIAKWRNAALPQSALAEALIDAGVAEAVRTWGPQGAAAMLLKLANEFGRSASGSSVGAGNANDLSRRGDEQKPNRVAGLTAGAPALAARSSGASG